MAEEAKSRVNSGNAVLIVFDETDAQLAKDQGFTGAVKTVASETDPVQGAEFSEVFVHIPQNSSFVEEKGINRSQFNRYMLTAASRGENFVGVVMDGKDSVAVEKDKLRIKKVSDDISEQKKVELYNEVQDIVKNLSDIDTNTSVTKNSRQEEVGEESTDTTEPTVEEETSLEEQIENAENSGDYAKADELKEKLNDTEQVQEEAQQYEPQKNEAREKQIKSLKRERVDVLKEIKKLEKIIKDEQVIAVDKVLETEVSDSEIDEIAKEEGIGKDKVKERIKEEVVVQMNDKSPIKPTTLLQKVASKVKKTLLSLMVVTTLFSNISLLLAPTLQHLLTITLKLKT